MKNRESRSVFCLRNVYENVRDDRSSFTRATRRPRRIVDTRLAYGNSRLSASFALAHHVLFVTVHLGQTREHVVVHAVRIASRVSY